MTQWHKKDPTVIFEKEIETVMRGMYYNSDLISQIHSVSDIEKNRKEGKMSAILTIEGTAGFGFNPALLENLYQIGFRITTLGWNEQNPLCGSHKTGGGLTDLGREYVKEAQRLGMIIDVSHISDEAFWDIMNITEKPVIASHSNSRSVCPVSRNLTDDMFRAICQSGGVAGFNMCAPFVGEDPDLDTCADHFIHFLELGGEKHMALGGDLDGCDVLPRGFAGVQDYPKLADKLLERGFGEDLVSDIFWNNAMEVMRKCCT
jgi:membrane dipeptidase